MAGGSGGFNPSSHTVSFVVSLGCTERNHTTELKNALKGEAPRCEVY